MKKLLQRLNFWILKNNAGQVLCTGASGGIINRFHLESPAEAFSIGRLSRYIHPRVRWLARKCAKVANEEIRRVYRGQKGLKDMLVRPVRVEVVWREMS